MDNDTTARFCPFCGKVIVDPRVPCRECGQNFSVRQISTTSKRSELPTASQSVREESSRTHSLDTTNDKADRKYAFQDWHGKIRGPIEFRHIGALRSTGVISRSTNIYSFFTDHWRKADSLFPDLFADKKNVRRRKSAKIPPEIENFEIGRRPVPHHGPKGFGGWLILAAIMVAVTPVSIVTEIGALSFLKDTLLPEINFTLLASIDLVFLAVWVWAAVLFFQKRRQSTWLIPNLVFLRAGISISYVVLLTSKDVSMSFSDVFLPILAATGWALYFRFSKRVKNTFVK